MSSTTSVNLIKLVIKLVVVDRILAHSWQRSRSKIWQKIHSLKCAQSFTLHFEHQLVLFILLSDKLRKCKRENSPSAFKRHVKRWKESSSTLAIHSHLKKEREEKEMKRTTLKWEKIYFAIETVASCLFPECTNPDWYNLDWYNPDNAVILTVTIPTIILRSFPLLKGVLGNLLYKLQSGWWNSGNRRIGIDVVRD